VNQHFEVGSRTQQFPKFYFYESKYLEKYSPLKYEIKNFVIQKVKKFKTMKRIKKNI